MIDKARPRLEVAMDADRRRIIFGRHELGLDLDLNFKENLPALDSGTILLTQVVTQGNRGRASHRELEQGGLTTYGTHAAAHFAAYQLANCAKSLGFSKAANVFYAW
jgi:hypothetical protein